MNGVGGIHVATTAVWGDTIDAAIASTQDERAGQTQPDKAGAVTTTDY